MKYFITIILFLSAIEGFSQNNSGTSFYGESNARASLCPERRDALSEHDVNNLITEILWKSYHIKNSYIIINCSEIANCQAAMHEGKPYILYNPNFLGRIKKLNFSVAELPGITEKDWETLTLLAHELGHHLNGHLTNPKPDATQWNQELEADETAGFIIRLMGGTLAQAQLPFRTVPEQGTYTHPGRQKRIEAVTKGWNEGNRILPADPIVTTETNTIIDIEDNIYKTIKIGTQVWMQSNLQTSVFANGDTIPQAKTKEEWEEACSLRKPAWCYYNNSTANGGVYGKLYNWFAVKSDKKISPAGWHIPSIDEWKQLCEFYGGESSAGSRLKSDEFWYLPNTGVAGNSSFRALPGGRRDENGRFEHIGKIGYWWSSDAPIYGIGGDFWILKNESAAITHLTIPSKYAGFSIRCIKD